ncbi:MAG: RNA polymerase sigma-70 factor [Chitinophagaceae bacterium]|nr:RNA polymerase sigma-70 factor [Chitinophagaceae bacterium]
MHTKAIACNSEKALMLLSSTGDSAAFTQLFHLYKHKLYSFIVKLTGSSQMAEDIIQDIFTKIWTQREHLPQIEKLGSYLFRMAQNHSINAFRKMATETLALSRLQPAPDHNTTEYYLNEKETSALLHEALSRLSAQQKLVYMLSREEGLKYEEIAHRLNLSPSTVKNHMIAALRTLRQAFYTRPDVAGILLVIQSIGACFEK